MIFIDTGAFFASKVENDVNHVSAREVERAIQQEQYGQMFTTNYIFDELMTLLALRIPRLEVIRIGNAIKASSSIHIIWIHKALEEEAWNYFQTHHDKAFSFTDCTSFVVMNALGIHMAFTYDHHFEQAGFVVIPSNVTR